MLLEYRGDLYAQEGGRKERKGKDRPIFEKEGKIGSSTDPDLGEARKASHLLLT